MKKRMIKMGDRTLQVAYNMAEIEILEKEFNAPLSSLFTEIQGKLSTKGIRILVRVGLEGGELAAGKNNPHTYTDAEIDVLLSGRILPISEQFMEALVEDLGIEIPEDAKNQKARKQQ